jgi:TPR repeat protein
MVAGAATAEPLDVEVSVARPTDGASPATGPVSYPEDAAAQYRIGLMYETGQGAPHDYGGARRWYLKAASHDDPQAEFRLGVLDMRGLGGPKDHAAAGRWFRSAADQGLAAAQFNLGVMYVHRLGVPKDYVAHLWLSQAARAGRGGRAGSAGRSGRRNGA